MKKRIGYLVLVLLLVLSSLTINRAQAEGLDKRFIRSRNLVFRENMASDQILMVKDFFRAQERANVPWGYVYDKATLAMVKDYQKSQGLKADGIIGPSTLDKMNQDIVRYNYFLGERNPSTKVRGEMIIINKSSNTLYFMKDGSVVKSFPVATGKDYTRTPDGQHKVVVKLKNPAWGGAGRSAPIAGGAPNNPLGKRWIGISYGGGGKYGIHGNSAKNSIGRYVSLGCIRMLNEDVESFYEEVKNGTPVWIGGEEVLGQYGVEFIANKNPLK